MSGFQSRGTAIYTLILSSIIYINLIGCSEPDVANRQGATVSEGITTDDDETGQEGLSFLEDVELLDDIPILGNPGDAGQEDAAVEDTETNGHTAQPNFLTPDDESDDVCHPLSLTVCCLPMPSNTFTTEGLDSCVDPEILAQVDDDFYPSNMIGKRDGFSPSMAVQFEAPFAIDEDSIPLDGGNVIKVFDLDNPQSPAIPVRARLSRIAELENEKDYDQGATGYLSQVIEVLPRSRFPYGSRLVAVLTTELESTDGTRAEAADLPSMYDYKVAYLAARGIHRNQIVSLTEFTIASEQNTTGPIFAMADVVSNQEHPVRNLTTEYPLLGNIGAIVRGEVRLTSFRKDNGVVDFDDDEGEHYWTEFDLYLPDDSRHGKVPIVIYGHGLASDRSSAEDHAGTNANWGVATIAIDYPNHGSRSERDGGFLLDNFEVSKLGLISGMANQGVIDAHSLMKAVRTSIAGIDVLPRYRNWYARLVYNGGYDVPDIDPEKIYYMGTSLGGVFGSGFVGSAEGLDGAFLQVTGTGIMRTLGLSKLWTVMGFDGLVPDELNGAETAMIFHAMQHSVDFSDGNNLIHNVRDPNAGGQVTPLVVQFGLNDGVVHNDGSIAVAELAGLPQMMPMFEYYDHLDYSWWGPVDGFALYQTESIIPIHMFDPAINLIGGAFADIILPFIRPGYELGDAEITDLLPHASFYMPRGQWAHREWLESMD